MNALLPVFQASHACQDHVIEIDSIAVHSPERRESGIKVTIKRITNIHSGGLKETEVSE
jgi:hypothetical protein